MTEVNLVAPGTPLGLAEDDMVLLGRLRAQLSRSRTANSKKYAFYEGVHKARNLDIAVPPHLADLDVFVGAPGIVVDRLAERIRWDGWISTAEAGDLFGLDEVYRDNAIDVEQSRETIDSLICGMSFVSTGTGRTSEGEPPVIVAAESPSSATVLWDTRRRTETAGLVQRRDPVSGQVTVEVLYLPNRTVTIAHDDNLTAAKVIETDVHNLGTPPMVQFPNRERPSDVRGRSEITPPIRYFTEAIVRTLLGMEINREFYTAPQRYGLGVDPSSFGIDEDSPRGKVLAKQWQIAMSRMNFIPGPQNPGDPMPQVGQFTPAPPTPYIDQVRHYLQHVSAESSVPWHYFGFSTENPPSADAIRSIEAPLVARAKLRQAMWTRAWRKVALLAILHRDPTFDRELAATITPNWLDPKTPTPAADADNAVKLVGADILPAHSPVTARRVGLSQDDQTQLERDRRTGSVAQLVDRLTAAPPVEVPAPPAGTAEQAAAEADTDAGSGS